MKSADAVEILSLREELIFDIAKTNEHFPIIGRIKPSLHDGVWSYEEELFETPGETRFPDDLLDWSQYIDQDDKALFLAYVNGECVGQIRVVKEWNRFCYIENIASTTQYRGHGIGARLLERAEEWAKEKDLIGMSLEAQDDNLIACRFYIKHGFILGGVDTLKQSYNKNIEATLYWYKLFN